MNCRLSPSSRLLFPAAMSVFLSLTACSPPKPETFLPTIQQEGQVFIDALRSRDEVVAASMMPAGYLKLIDGRVEEYLNFRINAVREKSFAIKSATVGIPQVPQDIDGLFVSFVPVRSKLQYDDGGNIGRTRLFGPTSITLSSYLVAVSSNKGKTWKFFESEEERGIIDKVLPETVGKLIIPAELADAVAD